MSKNRTKIGSIRKRKIRTKLFAQQNGICALCGFPMFFEHANKHHPLLASIDHILRKRHGGKNAQTNLRLAHIGCNALRD